MIVEIKFYIDYKHFLNPINASETADRMIEVNKGFMQINSYENFFNEFPDSLLELEVFSKPLIYKLLVTRHPTPVPVLFNDIFLTDTLTFMDSISRISNFSDLESIIKNDPRVEVKQENFEPLEILTEVEDWKFVRFAYSGKN